MNATGELVRYDAACRAVAEAKSFDEVKDILDKSVALSAYARQAKNKQLEIDASEIRFRAERRVGEMMAESPKASGGEHGGRPSKDGSRVGPSNQTPTLSSAGIDKHLADRARKYAAIPEQKFESILTERRERIEQENERVTVNLLDEASKHVNRTSFTGDNQWFTPDEHLELARSVLGGFDLDPASHEIAQRRVRAAEFFTEQDNGLTKEWCGRIWLNPPYAQPEIGFFADKMVDEVSAGNVRAAIMLTHNYTDTAWFQKLARAANAICFTRGRIRFVSPEGELAAPTQGQAFFYFGPDVEKFHRVFSDEVGFVVEVRQ